MIDLHVIETAKHMAQLDHATIEEYLNDLTHTHLREMRILTQRIANQNIVITELQDEIERLNSANDTLRMELLEGMA